MKKIVSKLVGGFCLAAAITSCSDYLDIDPIDNISEEAAITDTESIQALLVGAYDRMSDNDVYGGWFQMTADLLGTDGDVNWNGTFVDPREIWSKGMTAANARASATWIEAYETINVANTVLANLDVVDDQDERDRIEGEAKFIRGMVYFDLVRLFAKDFTDGNPANNLGVPIKTAPSSIAYNPVQNEIGRSTVDQVYALVLADLQTAETLLPEDNSFFATTWAAKAILARVRLQRGEYDAARILANDVIENGGFQLVDRVDRAFNQTTNTSEDVFAIQVTQQDGLNDFNTFYAATTFNGRRDIRIRAELNALYSPTDDRRELLIYFDAAGRRLSGKFNNQFAIISVVRLAELYLIRAEGNLLAGGIQVGPNTPAQDIQVLRTRATAPDGPLVATIADVSLERRLELAFEGHLIHDKRRRQATINQNGPLAWNADELVLPIPQREIDSNPALANQQNPGYEGN